MPTSERERLLAVANPNEWDCWLSQMADYYGHLIHCMKCFWLPFNPPPKPPCLICKAFHSCSECRVFPEERCWRIDFYDLIDAAIARLEKAGIWDAPCPWCTGPQPIDPTGPVSHGMCPECAARMRKEIED